MYDIIPLATQDGRSNVPSGDRLRTGHIVALNSAGYSCGSVTLSSGRVMPAVWSPGGEPRLLDAGPHGGAATAINDRGDIVGYEYTTSAGTHRRAIAWIEGSRVTLPNPAGIDGAVESVAAAISNEGMIGGRCGGHFILWSGAGSKQASVQVVDAGFSSYFGPNGRGVIAGRIGLPERGESQCLGFWRAGRVTHREFPAVEETFRYYVTGLNGQDQVLVSGSNERYDDLGWFALISAQRNVVVDRRMNGLELVAYDLNDAGTVVGRAELGNGRGFPFIWTAGDPVDLNRLLPYESSFTLFAATAINNHGMILAYADDMEGHEHQLLLVPYATCPV